MPHRDDAPNDKDQAPDPIESTNPLEGDDAMPNLPYIREFLTLEEMADNLCTRGLVSTFDLETNIAQAWLCGRAYARQRLASAPDGNPLDPELDPDGRDYVAYVVASCVKRGWVSPDVLDDWGGDDLADDRRVESFLDGFRLELYRARAEYLEREWSPDINPDDPDFSELLPEIDE